MGIDVQKYWAMVRAEERKIVELQISGARPWDPPPVNVFDQDVLSNTYGQRKLVSGGVWCTSREREDEPFWVAGRVVLMTCRNAAEKICDRLFRLSELHEVEAELKSQADRRAGNIAEDLKNSSGKRPFVLQTPGSEK